MVPGSACARQITEVKTMTDFIGTSQGHFAPDFGSRIGADINLERTVTMATKASLPESTGLSAASSVHSRASGSQTNDETLNVIAMFFAIGLIVSLILASI
jgi:hypothetical protein